MSDAKVTTENIDKGTQSRAGGKSSIVTPLAEDSVIGKGGDKGTRTSKGDIVSPVEGI
jgi:hypothetical protein